MVILWGEIGQGVAFGLFGVVNGAVAVVAKVAAENIKESNMERNLNISHNDYSMFAYRMRSKMQCMDSVSLNLKELSPPNWL